ncbi:helicase-related protein [Rhodobacter maris]|uniref:ATP-dependent RNA helicase SUPV3L1/SUV3 n=1 Tax=Rhodobacter maris TaxID=446682 RepID=A0A285SBK3_9RHOB|nr:helicase-related protein [Rhodobacter maris]SOC05048.1 ATP-dependent RNA helicase SUPV3L1/SUV3 [Rhodobacter maris]
MTGRITAVLGPTNTGKTHYAIERMLAHRTGVIGLPLRLLAREVYDRIVKARGPSVVALVTGEERIVPERAQYWVCTTEAMPELGADFVAIDEIQLCADPERGHVFTDRLLYMRGLHETLFLGSESMKGAIAALVPKVQFTRRERFSKLSWAGSKKISRMKPRAAIVGFSVDNVYAIAELIRRQKGGAAVVMGALSPRTRNAQVEMYQNGDVDYLVATDAIGMGLNLDIEHVAFSATAKFDGRRMRHLFPHEIGQIAGRAGRHTQDGTFGVTGEAHALPEDVIEAVEEHRFAPIQRLQWRNPRLEFGTVARLIASLETAPRDEWLTRGRDADDLLALKALADFPEIRDRVRAPADVRLLWDVCRIPDFRSISEAEHATLLARIFGFLQTGKGVPSDWLTGQIARIDRTSGDIDTLSKRLAFIRTWTYVAQRKGWVDDETHWREETRAVEDRLSDALHGALTQRFVDRRTSVLLRRLKQKETLVAEVNDKGEVMVEGEFAGRLEGFRFRQDGTSSPDEAKMLARAAYEALKPEFSLRSDRFYNAPDTEMDFTEQGGLMWGELAVGKLVKGAEALKPTVDAFVDEEAGPEVVEKVRRRLQHFIDRKVAALFEPLLAMSRDEALTGLARGFAFRLVEGMGILPREGVAAEVKELDQEARGLLRKHGVRFGQYTIFQQALLKPAPTRLRLVLASLWEGLAEFPESPPPGLVTIPYIAEVPSSAYTLSGYRPAGSRAIRIDMLERLADILRTQDSKAGFEATPDMLSITGMTLEQFSDLMAGLGYRAEKAERPKARPAPEPKAPEAEAGAENPIPEESSPVAEAEAEALATEAETEVFYTFAWAPRPRADRGPRRNHQGGGQSGNHQGGEARHGGGPREGRNEGRGEKRGEGGGKPRRHEGEGANERGGERGGKFGGKPKGGKHGGPKGGKSDDRGRGFESHPPKKDKPIDPDNPFAAALMGLKGKL